MKTPALQSTAVPKERLAFLGDFAAFEKSPAAQSSAWLHPARKAGIDRFDKVGFPTTRDEEWRYTSVEPISSGKWTPSWSYKPDPIVSHDLRLFAYGLASAHRLVFVNGHYARELSRVGKLPAGAIVCPLAEALTTHRSLVEPALGNIASADANPFTALNTAFIHDGAFVHVPEGQAVPEPIQLLFLSHGAGVVSHPRNLVLLGRAAQASVIEIFASPSCDRYLTNTVTEIALAPDARLESVRIQEESGNAMHVATTQAALQKGSYFSSNVVVLGAQFHRHDLNVHLGGEHAEAQLYGLSVASGNQLVDNHTAIDHAQPHCPSREFYKAILNGRAHSVFNGKVFVRLDAQKTDAKQTNKNLLLSEEARVDTKPQLEIFADDVKCTHGATVGQLDDEMLFYCRTRGLAPEIARGILTYAFARDVIQHVPIEPVRRHLDEALAARLLDAGKMTS